MKTLRQYMHRAPRVSELDRVINAKNACAKMLGYHAELSEVEIHLRNRSNPNGFVVRMKRGAEPKVDRFIMLKWARENGYWDACETKGDCRKFAKKFPNHPRSQLYRPQGA